MMNVIFIAPPAAGKGTISSSLVHDYNYIHLSTGDLLREVAKTNHEIAELMQSGKFISDDIIFGLIKDKIVSLKDKAFILDGVPRNLNQAKYLTELLKEIDVDNYLVINIDISKDTLEKRATGRRICPQCGASYNIYFPEFQPTKENTCNECGSELIARSDDSLETFKVRYQTYLDNTLPVLDYYQTLNKLVTINANQDSDLIMKDVLNSLKVKEND